MEQGVIVGVGDYAASNNPLVRLSTFALGSCVGLLVYDHEVPAAGLLHCLLPESKGSARKDIAPATYVDAGFDLLMRSVIALGARRTRLRAIVAGGASIGGDVDFFRIGERNLQALDSQIKEYPLDVIRRFTGGTLNRTMHFSIGTGQFVLKTPAGVETYACYGKEGD